MNKFAPVLLLEDDVFMQMRIKRLLLELGLQASEIKLASTLAQVHSDIDFVDINMALIDLGLPDGSGLSVVAALSEARPEIPIMVISAFSSADMVLQALQAGANGYLLKERDDLELLVALRSVMRGGSPIDPAIARFVLAQLPSAATHHSHVANANEHSREEDNEDDDTVALTAREHLILDLVSTGLSNQEIADEIYLSRFTVETHIRKVYRKLAVNSRIKAVHKARDLGLL
ncbi:response regulator transcription factor [Vitreoscilla massiliensis]|uniref:Response regulator transcription factor n=1 Tax=Vitreoscilla massiliensis TaxID=1689272 RepID=A0ABY4E1Q9_9NEIS|nr:response regulator transcription factor [Vitreoscilla massiliensis]UOO89248.1 response regulator transcription factor [Vitreoscilla massiliensis]